MVRCVVYPGYHGTLGTTLYSYRCTTYPIPAGPAGPASLPVPVPFLSRSCHVPVPFLFRSVPVPVPFRSVPFLFPFHVPVPVPIPVPPSSRPQNTTPCRSVGLRQQTARRTDDRTDVRSRMESTSQRDVRLRNGPAGPVLEAASSGRLPSRN